MIKLKFRAKFSQRKLRAQPTVLAVHTHARYDRAPDPTASVLRHRSGNFTVDERAPHPQRVRVPSMQLRYLSGEVVHKVPVNAHAIPGFTPTHGTGFTEWISTQLGLHFFFDSFSFELYR